ncbi:DUF1217 domain-containing protein [Acidimangrovimonas pyrenivorans]|uniref:DUF1217 domain-containing protein n=1 Tax=Acidimangrovimonas pyrenivorans TaxID=2030798 RepID=A0ABV7AMB9_9RHOB
MLSISGMTGRLALTLLDKTKDAQLKSIENDPANARAIARFRDQVGSINTVDDLVGNYDVYSFVMKAYDLKDQMFGKAMMKQILSSDPTDKTSLLNKLTDSRFRTFYNAMGFTSNGQVNVNTLKQSWQDQVVQRFVEQQYINDEGSQNDAVGTVLSFRQKVGGINSWYDVLKDKKVGQFMRTALQIPDGVVAQDLDRQVKLFEDKFDIKKLQDPAEVEKLVSKYVAISDAKNAAANAANDPGLQLISGALSSDGSGQFVPATLDISSIDMSAFSASSLYR